jgi:hypothetical protein
MVQDLAVLGLETSTEQSGVVRSCQLVIVKLLEVSRTAAIVRGGVGVRSVNLRGRPGPVCRKCNSYLVFTYINRTLYGDPNLGRRSYHSKSTLGLHPA